MFKGTYGPVTWNTETKSILFLGDENKLYFPQPSGDDIPHLGAFRAYFELDPTAHVREFNLNFGEETSEATIISPAEIKEIAEIIASLIFEQPVPKALSIISFISAGQ